MARAWRRCPKKSYALGGHSSGGCSPCRLSFFHVPVASHDSAFWSPFFLATPYFWDVHMGTISERRKCRSDEPSGISNMIQMGEFSQTTCIADDQANHRSQPRDVGELPRSQSAVRLPPGRTTSSRSAFGVVKTTEPVPLRYQTHISFSLSVLSGTFVSAPPVAVADECVSSASTTTLDEAESTNICVLRLPSPILSSLPGTIFRILRRSGIEQGAVGDAVFRPPPCPRSLGSLLLGLRRPRRPRRPYRSHLRQRAAGHLGQF